MKFHPGLFSFCFCATLAIAQANQTSKDVAEDWEKNPSLKALKDGCDIKGFKFNHIADYKDGPGGQTIRLGHLVRNLDANNTLPVKWPRARWIHLKWLAEGGIDHQSYTTSRKPGEEEGEILYSPTGKLVHKAGTYTPAYDAAEKQEEEKEGKKVLKIVPRTVSLADIVEKKKGVPLSSTMYSQVVDPASKAEKHTIDLEVVTSVAKVKEEYQFTYEFRNNGAESLSVGIPYLSGQMDQLKKIQGVSLNEEMQRLVSDKRISCAVKEPKKLVFTVRGTDHISGFTERYELYFIYLKAQTLNQGVVTLYVPEAKKP